MGLSVRHWRSGTRCPYREVSGAAAMQQEVDVSLSAPPRGRTRRLLGMAALVFVIALLLVLYMGLWKGIWFDELLHYAMGGMTFEYVIKTIDYTTMHVNHGQTGVYFLLDWLLMQVAGASALALRLPSIISAFVMLVAAVLFIRAKGFGRTWQIIVVLAIGANETLMFYTGEARPYMPLAASAAAILTFYALSPAERKTWWARLLALFGFCFGAVIHPYWSFTWVLLAAFSLALVLISEPGSRTLARAWHFLAPVYVIPSVVLYLVVGKLTWMRHIINFGWNPDEIYNWPLTANAFMQDHFSFVPYAYPPRFDTGQLDIGLRAPLVAAALALITVVWLVVDRRSRSIRLLPPLLLFVLATLTSVIATYLSYRSLYYVFERQWVAGMALTAIAATWFFAEWWRNVGAGARVRRIPAVIFVGLVIVSFVISSASQAAMTVRRAELWKSAERDTRSVSELIANPAEESFLYEPRNGYEYAADVNIARGGPVWEVFVRWYNKEAGMRKEFRESDWNWTTNIWPDPAPQSFLCLPEREWECPTP